MDENPKNKKWDPLNDWDPDGEPWPGWRTGRDNPDPVKYPPWPELSKEHKALKPNYILNSERRITRAITTYTLDGFVQAVIDMVTLYKNKQDCDDACNKVLTIMTSDMGVKLNDLTPGGKSD